MHDTDVRICSRVWSLEHLVVSIFETANIELRRPTTDPYDTKGYHGLSDLLWLKSLSAIVK
jgi:hypothetical protein